jgi:transcriptional regulator with XRE-family HTH domain
MSFGTRILELRKANKLSQTELGEKVGVHKNVLGKYERDEVKPSIDVALKIADYFEVSLDYLTGKVSHKVDPDIVERVTTIQSLPDSDREHILFAIDAMLRDAKTRFAYSAS